MKKNIYIKTTVIFLIILLSMSSCISAFGSQLDNDSKIDIVLDEKSSKTTFTSIKEITLDLGFSDPEVALNGDYYIVRVNESDLNRMDPGKPVLPVNLTILEFPFGTLIENITYELYSPPENITIPGKLAFGSLPVLGNMRTYSHENVMDEEVYEGDDPYPVDWVSYHTGGGLSYGEHTTFLVVKVYPTRYFPQDDKIQFIQNITITIKYMEPIEPILEDNDVYDLLIITPSKYKRYLRHLANHKNRVGVKTKIIELKDVYNQMYWNGRDRQEKIKYFIKEAIENWGITHVLLVGGLKSQTFKWDLPVRYSRVVPYDEQEYPEQSFISDLYYADIYDSKGDFSSWDSNNDNIFAVWNESFKEEMDIYPDVYLGRLPCRNTHEVMIMVKKIIHYEKEKADDEWFKNLILVAGDSYNDTFHFNEGELISEKAIEYMPGFTPVKVYASEQDINRKSVNDAMNTGGGFAYFCGHGSAASWNTHFPSHGTDWCTGYTNGDMIFLRNRHKLPITVVGGCHNGQFDVTFMRLIKGVLENRLQYFSTEPGNLGEYWYREWIPKCWAWWLTSKNGGGAIATIANTGLGTHGNGDSDNNSIADYLEILDGWLELRFLQLYGEEQSDILGLNHGETMTEYLHRFFKDEDVMDMKMVQQWELFGDPSLKIGGYV